MTYLDGIRQKMKRRNSCLRTTGKDRSSQQASEAWNKVKQKAGISYRQSSD